LASDAKTNGNAVGQCPAGHSIQILSKGQKFDVLLAQSINIYFFEKKKTKKRKYT